MSKLPQPWAVVIFACRETSSQLLQTLEAALVSASSCAVIHVLVNGNATLASALVNELTKRHRVRADIGTIPAIHVWSIPLGDKANAWNQYIHRIWEGEEIAFFVDGYVRLNPDAVELLGNAVKADRHALGGTGVPSVGRSAKTLREELINNTGYHGNFCCIKSGTIGQMRQKKIGLPVGLYRTDSLMGAILCYALDPSKHSWEDFRIHVHPTASWQIDLTKWWRFKDLRTFLKRYFRQARGTLEKAAFAEHLANLRYSPALLPRTAGELVSEWADRCPEAARRLTQGNLLMKQTLESFRVAPSIPESALEPVCVWRHAPKTAA